MPETHAARRDRLRTLTAEAGAEAALVTSITNVRYLTGFTGSNAALLVTGATAVLATDGRYTTQSEQQSPDIERLIEREVAHALVQRAGADGIRTMTFEAAHTSVAQHRQLTRVDPAPHLLPQTGAVESLRAVKDEGELALIREACAISVRALAETLGSVAPGHTELDVSRRLEACMFDLGAEALSFSTIVGTGPNSAVPHHSPTDREIARGDLLVIDFGALYGGYHADCTRTVIVGRAPEDWQREIYDVVRQAQRAGRHALGVDVDVQTVDSAARDVVVEAGYGEQFPHGLGHGVGLEIHEAPMMGYGATGRLAARTPLTVEPGVYLPGRGGVRIEDTLVVGAEGPELLTTAPKDLLVL